ncbi:HNRNPABD [Mytilus coruscus]|uniref:HNRNPABD n=1 Tax=Mytilus coruscus TaxID=42192 RepID=A0A6J8C2W4_MYTCO|nr:HNRNPABD [Mytilus coruscus]
MKLQKKPHNTLQSFNSLLSKDNMVKTQAILVLMCVAMAYGGNYGNGFNYGNNYQYTGSYVGSNNAGTFNRNANSYSNYGGYSSQGYNRYTPGGYGQGYNKYASGVYGQMIVPHPYPLPVPVVSRHPQAGNRVLVVRNQGTQNNGFLGFGGNGIFGFIVTILFLQYIMQRLTNTQNQAQ